MIKVCVLFVLIFSCAATCAADPWTYFAECQEIASASITDVVSVAASPGSPWVVLKTLPDDLSGALLAGSGRPVVVSGTYTVVAQLGSPVTRLSGEYNWPIVHTLSVGRDLTMMHEMPFCNRYNRYHPSGDYVLCKYNELSAGFPQFAAATAVPDDWVSQIGPAVDFLRSHPDLLSPDQSQGQRSQWLGLVGNANPYIAIAAVRALSSDQDLSTDAMAQAIHCKDAKVGATAVCIAVRLNWFDDSTNSKSVDDLVSSTKSLNTLLPVAEGLSEAEAMMQMLAVPGPILLPSKGVDAAIRILGIMSAVRAKLNELDPNGGSADIVWSSIDQACMGFRR